ncbi:hypothetical protein LMG19083_02264 [Ralstonia psammae]|uniref:Uncharacterized protein n=1 Tax=Ralstonia psammae TaxID=3058598 RepID=A0ABM9JG41_9RALS|nr:hypothetical protein LMG19083_02264 [Ralstonia sp. LMG 19083]
MKRDMHFVFSTRFAEVTHHPQERPQLWADTHQKLQISGRIPSDVI